ncbi:MAG TPA: ABC transporter ATP-binding protein [Ilumatobacteraceae bacterium]|nr:ABC transporter ATP-binding protein [Ilumatobacteraceae bacterium]
MAAIEVRRLRKTYGSIVAVDDLSFDVQAGEVYALLGHNGAGKSTTVEILEGHRDRNGGEVSVLGTDPRAGGRELRDRIGIVLQSSGIEDELYVGEAIELYGACYRHRRDVTEVLELAGLAEQAGQRIGTLSGGQRRRIDLALGIVGRPELLFLDEPTTGFDPAARRRSWELIASLCGEGTTVLLTTHYLDEAEHLADRVGVLKAGRLIAEGAPSELIRADTETRVSFELPDGTSVGELGDVLPADSSVVGARIEYSTKTPTAAVAALTGWAVARGIELSGLSVTRPTLEDVFLGLVADDASIDGSVIDGSGP